MPKVIVTFRVEFAKEPAPSRWEYLQVTDLSIITELTRLGFRIVTGPFPGRIGEAVEVTGDAQAKNVKAAFELLSEHGFHAYPGPTVPPSLRGNHFAPKRERVLAPRPEMHADYFTPSPYLSNKLPGTWGGATEDGNCIIQVDSRQKNKLNLGPSDIDPRLLATQEFFTMLRDAGFPEVTWREVAYDKPDKVQKRLGILSSTVVMPRCLTPRVDEEGEPWEDEGSDATPRREYCHWNDAGCMPPILVFERHEVEALGAFDVAVTLERTGSLRLHAYQPSLLASRRFCEFVESHAITNIKWVPVRLLSNPPTIRATS